MTLHAFGDDAGRIWGRVGGDATILACEPQFASSALSTALMLRRAGVRFYAAIVLGDDRARAARAASIDASARFATWDEIRLTMHAFVDERPPAAAPAIADDDRASLHEVIRLADRLLVTSWAEFHRIESALGPVPRDAEVVTVADSGVPDVGAGERRDLVVYAPRETSDALAAFITALEDFQLPVVVIARDAPRRASRARFVAPGDAARALATARAVVDAGSDDPGVALALTRLGVPLVVDATSGATEHVLGAFAYEPGDRRSILIAVADAIAGEPPRPRAAPASGAVTLAAIPLPAAPANAPLISVVLTTFNRPKLLLDTLASIERQTYPNLEIIVVNDAGTNVADVVARAPRARYLENARNLGPGGARNHGLREARGEFVMFFDDDDEMFPDHVATLAAAQARSGLDVAYGQMINCFAIPAGPDRFVIDGLLAHYAVLDHAEIQWGGSLATTALLFRRSLAEQIGAVDESLGAAEDFEYWIRLAAGREWARCSEVTSMYFVRTDGTNRSANGMPRYGRAHLAIFTKHPSTRALVNAGRTAMLRQFESQG